MENILRDVENSNKRYGPVYKSIDGYRLPSINGALINNSDKSFENVDPVVMKVIKMRCLEPIAWENISSEIGYSIRSCNKLLNVALKILEELIGENDAD